MKTVGRRRALEELTTRVRDLRPDAQRQWGKMTLPQALSHLAGSMEWVLASGEARPWPQKPSKLIKHLALRVPLPWPKGIPNPNDPASVEVADDAFESLRERVLRALEQMSQWKASETTPPHPAFGPMTTWEWHRWAYKHADHHLKQFGS